ncbi:MAG: ABC transporter ATP-binding protein [Elusimicrobia bacterium]|nr:ABC transporter ATP-binding protein [Elusimicrobiota bacterium]
MSSPLIEVKKVSKIYAAKSRAAANKVTALNHMSLAFDSGEFTAIAGPSGSGKSTLLNLIGILDNPTHGEILYEGRRISDLKPEAMADFRLRYLGFVFQAYNLIPVLTAVENVEYPLVLQGMPTEERRTRALEVLRWVGLSEQAHRRPDLLSGGQQQRVAVARSIVHRPMVVLADEPTANLDSKTAASLLDLMQALNRDHGLTFIFSSHDALVLSRAKRVVHIRDGKLCEGPADGAP